MNVLLDTQCWLWMEAAPERLSSDARGIVLNPSHTLFLSAASAWEIAIKHALGKLTLPAPPHRYVPTRLRRSQISPLQVEHDHALRTGLLPPHHRDPFDRLLIAQAQVERMTILTTDPQFEAYDIDVLRA